MNPKFYVLHDIPGRLRLQIPSLRDKTDYKEIEHMFSSLKGILFVRIEPTIQTMLIKYDISHLYRNTIFRYISIFFQQIRLDPLDDIMIQIDPTTRKDWLRTLFSGCLLLLAGIRKSSFYKPDALVYGAVVATGYTVLSHGSADKIRHPDILTGIVTLLSLGPSNMLYVAMITWIVNVLELLHEKQKFQTQLLHMII
ncbi:HMA2 domain-containing protein [Peribacillus sp. NPDC096448]|uniref:HMA2 domain-containing protein n=1 Tax=Peribacillus sp. NPDC096448 TaxID=3364395 RepID=UPI00380C3CAC